MEPGKRERESDMILLQHPLELRMGVEMEQRSVRLRETEQTEREGGKKGTRGEGECGSSVMKHRWSSSNPPPIPASLPPPSPAPSLLFFPPGLSYLKNEDFSAAWAC